MMKHGILLFLLISDVSGFAAQPPPTAMENSASESCEHDYSGRRQFFVSIVGAASILAFDDASAEEFSDENHLSTNSFSVASTAVEAAKPVVDTRAIFDKAAKKVRNECFFYVNI